MKTTLFVTLTALMGLTITTVSSSEAMANKGLPVVIHKSGSPFASFRTHRQGKGVSAAWSIATTDGVVGFSVQRTYEDPTDPYAYWEELATVPFNASRSFTYTDKQVYPGTINYRVVALMSDGSTAASDLSAVRIVSRH